VRVIRASVRARSRYRQRAPLATLIVTSVSACSSLYDPGSKSLRVLWRYSAALIGGLRFVAKDTYGFLEGHLWLTGRHAYGALTVAQSRSA
jgi:hypothetical protein